MSSFAGELILAVEFAAVVAVQGRQRAWSITLLGRDRIQWFGIVLVHIAFATICACCITMLKIG